MFDEIWLFFLNDLYRILFCPNKTLGLGIWQFILPKLIWQFFVASSIKKSTENTVEWVTG